MWAWGYPLDSIETISDTISILTFYYLLNSSPGPPTANRSGVKGGTKLSSALRQNTSLKELRLCIPLDIDELYYIIESLSYNRSLEGLWLSEEYHSQYFSKSEQEALDSRVRFSH